MRRSLRAWLLLALIAVGAFAGVAVWFASGSDAPRGGSAAPGPERGPSLSAKGEVALDEAPDAGLAAPRAEAPLEVTVLDDAGEPVRRTRVVLYRRDRVLDATYTKRGGTFRVDAEHARCMVALCAFGSAPPQVFALDARAEPTLRLDRGVSLAGRVLLDGAVPATPIRMSIQPLRAPPELDLPPAVAAELLGHMQGWAWRKVPTDAAGAFRIDGLPRGWSGELTWSGGAMLASEVEDVLVPTLVLGAPRDDLVLRLVGDLAVRGRVIDELGAPISDARVWASAGPTSDTVRTATDGTFELELPRSAEKVARFRVLRPTAADPWLEFERELPPRSRTRWTCDDLVVPAVAVLRIAVVGPLGEPCKASVALEDERGALLRTMSTGRDGRCEVEWDSRIRTVTADAGGAVPARLDAPFDLVGENVLVLLTAATATLLLDVQPESSRKFLATALVPRGAAPDPRGTSAAWERVEFLHVPAGVPLDLLVLDGARRAVLVQPVPALEVGAHRDLAATLCWDPRTVYLRVHAAGGGRVYGADVVVEGRSVGTTDVTGELMLAGVAPGTAEVELRHGDFETLHDPALVVPPDRDWIELVMRPRSR